jgi:hypothetical protein
MTGDETIKTHNIVKSDVDEAIRVMDEALLAIFPVTVDPGKAY